MYYYGRHERSIHNITVIIQIYSYFQLILRRFFRLYDSRIRWSPTDRQTVQITIHNDVRNILRHTTYKVLLSLRFHLSVFVGWVPTSISLSVSHSLSLSLSLSSVTSLSLSFFFSLSLSSLSRDVRFQYTPRSKRSNLRRTLTAKRKSTPLD